MTKSFFSLICGAGAMLCGLSIPPAVYAEGWSQIPNTVLRDVCPPDTPEYPFTVKCKAVVQAWSGGAYDSLRNRLIMWGGGHNDYLGNELYALDLVSMRLERLTDPSLDFEIAGTCVDVLPDGNPTSRHTYGGLAYIAHADRLFAYGGSRGCGSGGFGLDTWTFDFSSGTWQRMDDRNGDIGARIVASAYDPVTKKVYLHNGRGFFAYDYDSNRWSTLNDNSAIGGFQYATATLDPARRKFVIVAPGKVFTISLDGDDGYTAVELETSGARTLMDEGRSPGLAYDSVRNRITAWNGSDRSTTPDTVYTLDLDTGVWTATTASGGPRGGAKGTFGRWQYAPNLDAFVVVSSALANAMLFRFDGSAPPPAADLPPAPADLPPAPINDLAAD